MLTDLLREMGVTPPRPGDERPLVGVSACLLGRPVRYDGDHKFDARVSEELGAILALREFCPEVGIGLPVPRPPIHVIDHHGEPRVRGVRDPERDFTDALHDYAERLPGPLDGFILKARSPSCGLGTTPWHAADGRQRGLTDGAFAARLRHRQPALPLCNDSDLDDPAALRVFVERVYRHWRARR